MARKPRFILPDLPVHIIQRGNDRMDCFRCDEDYGVYLALIRQLIVKARCALHAYCLMTNHVHLLLTAPTGTACSLLMKALSHRYAQYFNGKYQRTGTLWEGRYRSCLVESGRYVLACVRYIELNPVRAGIVSVPNQYVWSSYASNVSSRPDPLITVHPEVAAIGAVAYATLVGAGIEETLLKEIRASTNGGLPLASDAFKTSIAAEGRKVERGRPGPKPKSESQDSSVPDPDLGL
jgi:putative transposase